MSRTFATLNNSEEIKVQPTLKKAIELFDKDFEEYNIDELKKNDNSIIAVVELDGKKNIMRYIKTNMDYGVEMCPHCMQETITKVEFRVQHCVECGKEIKPCNLCELDYCNCSRCPLDSEFKEYIGGIKE